MLTSATGNIGEVVRKRNSAVNTNKGEQMAAWTGPAFQFYPKEFLSDANVAAMSLQELGAYIKLICLCWNEESLPGACQQLANMVGIKVRAFERLWPALVVCFVKDEDGRYRHPRLDKERQKQIEFKRRQSDRGRLGGRPSKAETKRDANPNVSGNQAGPKAVANPDKALQSPISNLHKEREEPAALLERKQAGAPVESPERAGRLRQELYPAWYAKHRHGAKLRLVANSLEFQDALTLVETWDDRRLEKLAQIVLTTDDEWISRTDRGFKIFALKATWADDRLKSWEREHGVTV